MRLHTSEIPRNKALVQIEDNYVSTDFKSKRVFNPIKLLCSLLNNTVFGINIWTYVKNLPFFMTVFAFSFFGDAKHIVSDANLYITASFFLYPYARILFNSEPNLSRYKNKGVTVTMTKKEYDSHVAHHWSMVNLIPYVFVFVLAPIGLIYLWLKNKKKD